MTMHENGTAVTMMAAIAIGMEAACAEEDGCGHCGGECAQAFTETAAMMGSLAVWKKPATGE